MTSVRLPCLAWGVASRDPVPGGELPQNAKADDSDLGKLGFDGPISARGVSMEYAYEALPHHALDIQLSCWLIEESKDGIELEQFSYLAERPMHAMLRTRGETGGLSTNELGEHNLAFNWSGRATVPQGIVYRGKPAWTEIESDRLPSDPRLPLSIDRVATTDLVMMANFSDL